MKVGVFGCSWSYGVPRDWSMQLANTSQKLRIPKQDYVNWTRELGKLRPEWEIRNFACPGSNIFYSCSMLDHALKNYDLDLTIFQGTSTSRFVYWSDNLIPELEWTKTEDNVYQLAQSNIKNMNIVEKHEWRAKTDSSFWTHKDWRTEKAETQFAINYFSRVSDDMFDREYRIFADYAMRHSDYFFTHLDYEWLKCDSVQGTLTDHRFDSFVVDSCYHFDKKGSKWQAQWILNKINTL